MMSNDEDYGLDDNYTKREKPDIETTLAALQSGDSSTLSATLFYGLSDLSDADLQRVKPVWDDMSSVQRGKLIQQMVDTAETDFELNYHQIGIYALGDKIADIREKAIDLLWENETVAVMNRLIELAQWDEAESVRASATNALSRFVLKGELGELSERDMNHVQDVVISILNNDGESTFVRRRALEAISNSSHEIVDEVIQEAYYSTEPEMRVSAVFAMGRTCDMQWEDIILRELDSGNAAMQYEAAKASGELELTTAVPALIRLVQDDDREIQETAIWALGEIGGNQAVQVLSELAEEAEEDEDEALLEAIEDAIGNASMVGGNFDFDFDLDIDFDD